MAGALPPGVFLSELDCAVLDDLLVRALRDVQLREGAMPARLAEVAAPIHAAATKFRANTLAERSNASSERGSGTGRDTSGSVRRRSAPTERLSVPEAARLAQVSESYLRRLARRGTVRAVRQGSRGGWLLDGGSVAVWVAERSEARKAG